MVHGMKIGYCNGVASTHFNLFHELIGKSGDSESHLLVVDKRMKRLAIKCKYFNIRLKQNHFAQVNV